jgi:hypothetical protein
MNTNKDDFIGMLWYGAAICILLGLVVVMILDAFGVI